jgi:phage FluMu protein Com
MLLDNIWKCPKCGSWNRITLEKCPECGYIKDIDPDAETKILPPIKEGEERGKQA